MHAKLLQLTKLALLGLSVLLVPGAIVSARPLPVSPQRQQVPDQAPDNAVWQGKLARDTRLSFTRRSAHEAAKVLDAPDSTETECAVALMAIGCTQPRAVRERPRLERWAAHGSLPEKSAALLALGEFGEGGDAVLIKALDESEPQLRQCAMLGLLRGGRVASLERVRAIADGTSVDSPVAKSLLRFYYNPEQSQSSFELQMWAGLRWSAARRYGLVDGETWKTRLLSDLLGSRIFLEKVVLGAVAEQPALGVTDHLLALLLESDQGARLKAAVVAMPEQLGLLIEAGLWSPRDVKAWRMILNEIDLHHSEANSLALLSQSLQVPEVSVASLRLLVRAGLPEVLVELEGQWNELSNRDKALACQAWAMGGPAVAPENLADYGQDSNPLVRAHVLVSAARLGDAVSHENLRAILADPEHADFALTVIAAIAQGDSPLIRDYLEQLLEHVIGDLRLEIATKLASSGISDAREVMLEGLGDGFPSGARGVRCIQALSRRNAAEHVGLFLKHFPVEDDMALNVALARAIIDAQHNFSYHILREALWKGEFDLSLLASAVMVQVGGIHTLRDEMSRAPLEASSRDMRRLGYALGEWGGLSEVQFLKGKKGLRVNHPILQGALLGALGRRTH